MSKLLTFILLILYAGPVQLWASSHADQARYNGINRSEQPGPECTTSYGTAVQRQQPGTLT